MTATVSGNGANLVSTAGVAGSMDTRNAGLDKETRLMVLCFSLLNLLDQRMSDQMDVMQARNERATELKGVVGDLNAALATFGSKSEPTSKISIDSSDASEQAAMKALASTLDRVDVPGLSDLIKNGKVRKSDLESAVSKVTGMMDSDSTIQQLDTLTLQSVFSKRNEVFELMSNAMKKCQDTKSTLVRNF